MSAVAVCSLLILFVFQVLSYPQPGGGGHNQWSNPQMGMSGGNGYQPGGFGGAGQQQQQQQRQGYGNGQHMQGNGGGHRGFGGNGGGGFGQNGYSPSQNRGRQQWQSGGGGGSGQGGEAYKTNVYNEPDRYGYDYTIPGANVHFMMHKKQGNRGSGNYGGSQGGMNQNNY